MLIMLYQFMLKMVSQSNVPGSTFISCSSGVLFPNGSVTWGNLGHKYNGSMTSDFRWMLWTWYFWPREWFTLVFSITDIQPLSPLSPQKHPSGLSAKSTIPGQSLTSLFDAKYRYQPLLRILFHWGNHIRYICVPVCTQWEVKGNNSNL